MRKTIYTKLKGITEFGNRIYQPYTAPENCATPYAVIKMYGDEKTLDNFKGQKDSFSVFIYSSPDSFISIDALVVKVKTKLDNVKLSITGGGSFIPEYIKTVEDAYDDIKNLFFKRIDFDIPGIRI